MKPFEAENLLDALFAPISAEQPCGQAVRYDRLYRQIQEAREADDPSLPQGEWERPLKRADWKLAAQLSQQLLTTHSKDLQVAAWLTEAWTYLHGLSGFEAGIALILALCEHYWDQLHPLIEEGEAEARIAPFVWLNDKLTDTLALQVPLFHMPPQGAPLTLAAWEAALREDNALRQQGDDQRLPRLREEILAAAASLPAEPFQRHLRDIQQAYAQIEALGALLDGKLGSAGPSLGRLRDTLGALYHMLRDLGYGELVQQAPAPIAQQGLPAEPHRQDDAAAATAPEAAPAVAQIHAGGPITSREDAYRRIAEAGQYLHRTEPHSPTPYLIQHALIWSNMTLAELVHELLNDQSDLAMLYRLLNLTGKVPAGSAA